MGLKIGNVLHNIENKIETGVKHLGSEIKEEAKEAEAGLKKGWGATTSVAGKVKDGFIDGAAQTVGLAELAGLRYPVSQYEFKVSDNFTRGSRIDDPRGYQKLKDQGFKSIVDLTMEGTHDKELAPKAGLNTLNVKILDNASPTNAQMKQFLDFVTNPANEPAYVHCEAGKGRTGVATAVYRMAVEGFTPEQAIADGKKYGLQLPGQIRFVEQFGAALKAGKIDGYPKPDA
jgi:hypothetical protein